jgi:hypothetical protein
MLEIWTRRLISCIIYGHLFILAAIVTHMQLQVVAYNLIHNFDVQVSQCKFNDPRVDQTLT